MDADLVARLRGVIPRLARELNDTSTGEGLTPTQYSVLALVRSRGPLGLAELTELEGLNPTMVSRIIKVLDERGLIRRMPDPNDLRAARLAATPMGEQVHDRVRAQRTQVLSERLGQLSPETAETLLAAVPAMEALAEAVKPLPRTVRAVGVSRRCSRGGGCVLWGGRGAGTGHWSLHWAGHVICAVGGGASAAGVLLLLGAPRDPNCPR